MAKGKDFTIEELELLLTQKRSEEKQQKKETKELEKIETKKIKLKKKLGFSERLVLWILLASWAVVFLGVVYSFKFFASEVWGYILDAIKWLSTGTVGFFIWKAKSENLIKIKENPNFNLEEYTQQMWDNFTQEANYTEGNNYYY